MNHQAPYPLFSLIQQYNDQVFPAFCKNMPSVFVNQYFPEVSAILSKGLLQSFQNDLNIREQLHNINKFLQEVPIRDQIHHSQVHQSLYKSVL